MAYKRKTNRCVSRIIMVAAKYGLHQITVSTVIAMYRQLHIIHDHTAGYGSKTGSTIITHNACHSSTIISTNSQLHT